MASAERNQLSKVTPEETAGKFLDPTGKPCEVTNSDGPSFAQSGSRQVAPAGPLAQSVLLYIPNLLTLLRILLVPFAIWLIISDAFGGAFFVLVAAGVSDGLDGFLAKRYGWTTQLGAYLDPLADKLLLVSTFVALGARALLPSWLVILVVSRDVMIVAAILLSVVLGVTVQMRPIAISKLNTVAQIALALLILADAGFGLAWQNARAAGIYATAVLTAASAAVYLWGWLRQMTNETPAGS